MMNPKDMMNLPIKAEIFWDDNLEKEPGKGYCVVIRIGKELRVVSAEAQRKSEAEASAAGYNWEIQHVMQKWCKDVLEKAKDIDFLFTK